MAINDINEFIIKDVRCFNGERRLKIRPLTFLIGENSTGKSTVLGCLNTLHNFFRYQTPHQRLRHVDFDSPPYKMGVFADIARKTKPPKTLFELGFSFKNEGFQCLIKFGQKKDSSEPMIKEMEWQFPDSKVTFKESLNKETDITHVENGKNEFVFFTVLSRGTGFLNIYFDLDFITDGLEEFKKLNEKEDDTLKAYQQFLEKNKNIQTFFEGSNFFKFESLHNFMKSVSIAPIRSEPQRTYNPSNEAQTPQGKEIPMFLVNLKRSDPDRWKNLKKQLVNFGESSGLFKGIDVRTFTENTNDPFQLQIQIRNQKAKPNLMDVGYGVSQILPILVRIFNEKKTRILMQQPEVHLHPKGQAALASLLVNNIKENKNAFIVETHSDFMIDRVRIEIMKGNIAPEDVSLIYLQANRDAVKVHNIEFDKQANLLHVPNGYRDFFLKETDELFGFEE